MRRALLALALAPALAAQAPAPGALDGYIGKYPFDPVGGSGFAQNSAVVERVRRAVPDRFLADHLLRPQVSTPIEVANGVIFSQSCEKSACGRQNWAILLPRSAPFAWVCYHNTDLTAGDARWFSGGQLVANSGSRCPQTIRDVPERIFRQIAKSAPPPA